MVGLRVNRKLLFLSIILTFNIFLLRIDLHAQDAHISMQDEERLDVNKINSSVDAGSFYSVDVSIRQFEENMAKMAQELNRLKQHVEFAKMTEQKRILQIQKLEKEVQKLEKEVQKLEKENVNSRQPWLNNSLDNSWTGSSSKMELSGMDSSGDKSNDIEPTTTVTVYQAEPAKTTTVTQQPEPTQNPTVMKTAPTQITIDTQSEPTKTATVASQMTIPQATAPQHVRQDVVVQVVE